MKKMKTPKIGRAIFEKKPYHLLSNVIFFLNLIIALLIVTGAWILVETELGQSAMILGFLMLAISVLLKTVRWW